jgi:hypothetical protein
MIKSRSPVTPHELGLVTAIAVSECVLDLVSKLVDMVLNVREQRVEIDENLGFEISQRVRVVMLERINECQGIRVDGNIWVSP